jgi:hypothetical protein
MTAPTQQDSASIFYPFNSCGHLRSPGGGCIGVPGVCNRRPVTGTRMVELARRAEELRTRLLYHPPERLKPEDFPGSRLTVVDKLGSALSLAECLNALIVSLLDDRAVLTLEDMVSVGKIGGNVVKQIRALEKILLGWVGTDDL